MEKIVVAIGAMLTTSPALALDDPVLWRDPDTSCTYWITPGAMTPRLRRDGSHDCPGGRIITNGPVAVIDESEVKDATVRDLVRTVERLQREVEAARRQMEHRR